ncbi:hypothetical protein ACQKWADRAFT_292301 [Trichoderma austrokoningii]
MIAVLLIAWPAAALCGCCRYAGCSGRVREMDAMAVVEMRLCINPSRRSKLIQHGLLVTTVGARSGCERVSARLNARVKIWRCDGLREREGEKKAFSATITIEI